MLDRVALSSAFAFLLVSWQVPVCAQAAPDAADEMREQVLEQVRGQDWTPEQAREWIRFGDQVKSLAKRNLTLADRFRRTVSNPWVMFGLFAQAAFMMRFVLQLIASERRKRSYVPVAFWYFSLGGGLMLLTYAIQRRDPVFVLGQGLGCAIYARNLYLIRRRRKQFNALRLARNGGSATEDVSPPTADSE